MFDEMLHNIVVYDILLFVLDVKFFFLTVIVCAIQTTMYAPLFNNFVVVVTMDHWSSLDLGTQWRTHQLIAQSH